MFQETWYVCVCICLFVQQLSFSYDAGFHLLLLCLGLLQICSWVKDCSSFPHGVFNFTGHFEWIKFFFFYMKESVLSLKLYVLEIFGKTEKLSGPGVLFVGTLLTDSICLMIKTFDFYLFLNKLIFSKNLLISPSFQMYWHKAISIIPLFSVSFLLPTFYF